MGRTLQAGAARRTINPLLGTGKAGLRLFGSPIQAIESDLTATALVLGDGDTKVALIATDLCVLSMAEGGRLRTGVAEALGIPVSHVLLNLSHNHSAPALPEFMAMTDTAEDIPFRTRYEHDLQALARRGGGRGGRPAAAGADRQRLGREHDRRLPARDPGRARRPRRGARPPHRPDRRRDPRRRPRRQPDRDRVPLLGPPGHRREPVAGRVLRLPRPGARGARAQPRRPRPLPPGLRRQHQPPRRDRLRGRLPRHQEPRRPRARRRGAQGRGRDPHQPRAPASGDRSGTCPTSSSPPGSPSQATPAPTSPRPRPPSRLDYDELPSLDEARGDPRALAPDGGGAAQRRRPRLGDPRRPEVRALGAEARRRRRGREPDPRSPHPGDPRQRHRDRGDEHGGLLRDGARDPRALAPRRHVRARLHERLLRLSPSRRGLPRGRLEDRRELRRPRPDPAGLGRCR